MSENLILIGIAVLMALIGALIGIYVQKLKTRSFQSAFDVTEKQLRQVNDELRNAINKEHKDKEDIRRERDAIIIQLTKKEAEFNNLNHKHLEQKEEINRLQEKFTKDFQVLANRILEEKSEKFTLQNKENIKNILDPLQQKIKDFEDKVEKSQKENISIHSALKEQLLHLQSQNLKITREAENLTKALKGDSKMQGNWGELVLERVLEKSGLEKDREYTVQQSFRKEDGTRVMPDVIIHLPDGKKMVVDAKVSLTHYEQFVNADDEQRGFFLKEHLNSIKRHVEQLSEKKYEDLYEMESPDFVLMFVPIEPAFAVALNEDNSLYSKAFEKNIVIVTPATLLATLRTIDTMWNNEKQQRNAVEIARQAGALYDKFEGLMNDLTRVGKKMDEAKTEYKGAMNKLFEGRGNIIISIEKLKKMGAKAKKSLPEPLLKRAEEADEND